MLELRSAKLVSPRGRASANIPLLFLAFLRWSTHGIRRVPPDRDILGVLRNLPLLRALQLPQIRSVTDRRSPFSLAISESNQSRGPFFDSTAVEDLVDSTTVMKGS